MPLKTTLKRKKRAVVSQDEEEKLVHEIESDEDDIKVITTTGTTGSMKRSRQAGYHANLEEPVAESKRSAALQASTKRETRGTFDKLGTTSVASISGQGTKGKMNLHKLEAMARATTKLKQDFAQAQSNGKECLPWVDRNFPKNLDEHFVHKKKVNDLRLWLQNSLNCNDPSRICLLSGPTGSGKTATAYLLANELDMEVKEWINPMSLTVYQENRNFSDEISGRSQTDLFSDFLLRSSQYSALPIKGRKHFQNKVVVIEDIPNQFYRDTEAFHNILRNFQMCGTSPVLFIVGDGASGANWSKLFTNNMLQELKVAQISFNAVAPTLMVKFLALVCSRENVTVPQPILEGVAAASGGDMRCAINTLQFKILQEKPATKDSAVFKRPLPRITKATRDNMFKSDALTQKDESMILFRALGKVLYNKRKKAADNKVEDQLIKNLSHHRRAYTTEDDPDEIAGKADVSTGTFIGFLNQNYINFFTSIEEVSKAAGYLSDAEMLLSNWNYEDCSYGSNNFKNQDRKDQLSLSVAIRGLMHSNTKPVSSTWRPLRKPLCNDVGFKTQKIVDQTRSIFPTLYSFVEGFFYEDIPFLAKITTGNLLNPDQRKLISEVGIFKDLRSAFKPKWTETLDEKFTELDEKISDTDEVSTNDSTTNFGVFKAVEIKSVETEVNGEEAGPEEFQIDEFED